MSDPITTPATALAAALAQLDAEAGTNVKVRAVIEALAKFHAELPAADRPLWASLEGLGAAYARLRSESSDG